MDVRDHAKLHWLRHAAVRRRLLPIAALHAAGGLAIACGVWAYAVQPDRPTAPVVLPQMEFVVPSQASEGEEEPLLLRSEPRLLPAVQKELPAADVLEGLRVV
jgi:hypothetical protein